MSSAFRPLLAICLVGLAPVSPAESEPLPKEEKKPRVDLYGDPLPDGAIARLGTVRFRHPAPIHSVAFSPDSKLLATFGHGHLCLWEVATGRKLEQLPANPSSWRYDGCLVFSRDGRKVIWADDAGWRHTLIRVWDLAARAEVQQWQADGGSTLTLAPDGRTLVTGSLFGLIQFWDLETGEELRRFQAYADDWFFRQLTSLLMRQEGRFWEGFRLCLKRLGWPWSLERFQMGEIVFHDAIHRLAFSPDGSILATTGEDRTLRLWDVATGTERCRLVGHNDILGQIAYSPDGLLLYSAGYRGDVRIWDVATGEELRQLEKSDERLYYGMVLSPDGRTLALTNEDGSISIWDEATGRELRRTAPHPNATALGFSSDGRLLASAGYDQTVRLWDPATGKEVRPLPDHRGPVWRVAWLAGENKLATICRDEILREWDVATTTAGDKARIPESSNIVLSPDRTRVAGGFGAIHLHDVATEEELLRFESKASDDERTDLIPLAFSPNGKILVGKTIRWNSGKDEAIDLWDTVTGKKLHSFVGGPPEPDRFGQSEVWGVALSPDAKLLAASCGKIGFWMNWWDVATGKEVLGREDTAFEILAFSPDGKTLVGVVNGLICCWETSTRKERFWLADMATFIVYQSQEEIIPAVVSMNPWMAMMLPIMQRWSNHVDPQISALTFAPDGRILAVGYHHGPIRLWDALSAEEIGCLEGHLGGVNSLAFTSDGSRLASASEDTTVLIWDVAWLRKRLPKTSTPATEKELEALWETLGSDEPRRATVALGRFVASSGQTLAFIKTRLQPVPHFDGKRFARLLADLDSDSFQVRENATRSLAMLEHGAERALRAALKNQPSPEVGRRLEMLLARLEQPERLPERLQALRAIELLEYIGNSESRKLLESLSKGAPEAKLTQDAKAALERLDRRAAGPPQR